MLIARDHRAEEAEGEVEPTTGGGRLTPAPAAPEP